MQRAAILFAKDPRPGTVKTRLTPPLAPEEAAELAAAFIGDTAEVLRGLEVERRIAAYAPRDGESRLRQLVGEGFELQAQVEGNLGDRMRAAFQTAFRSGSDRVVIVGSDSPSVPRRLLAEAFHVLESKDVVLGPSFDLGYYLIGLRHPRPELFHGVPWSTSQVFPRTLQTIVSLELDFYLLAPWYDVDDPRGLELLRADVDKLIRVGDRSRLRRTAKALSLIDAGER